MSKIDIVSRYFFKVYSSSNYLSITTQFSCKLRLRCWGGDTRTNTAIGRGREEAGPGGGGEETLYIGTYTGIHVHE